jgi:hypothetical protein
MPWAATAQTFRCKGRITAGHRDGEPVTRKCRTIVPVGGYFWQNGKRPLCPYCALDEGQHGFDADLEERRRLLEHKVGVARAESLIRHAEP